MDIEAAGSARVDGAAAFAAAADLDAVLSATVLGALDPALLSQDGRIDALLAMQRLMCWAEAHQQLLVAAVAADIPAPRGSADKNYRCEEVACALRWSFSTLRPRPHPGLEPRRPHQRHEPARPVPRHHKLKHETGWHVTRNPHTGATHWTSPTGRHYSKPAHTLPIDYTLNPNNLNTDTLHDTDLQTIDPDATTLAPDSQTSSTEPDSTEPRRSEPDDEPPPF